MAEVVMDGKICVNLFGTIAIKQHYINNFIKTRLKQESVYDSIDDTRSSDSRVNPDL